MTTKVKVTVYLEKEYEADDIDQAEQRAHGLIQHLRGMADGTPFDHFESSMDVISTYIPNGDKDD